MPALWDLTDFFKLSAALNYQLGAVGSGNRNILTIILRRNTFSLKDQEILLRVLKYLEKAYGPSRRRLGPLAVLHPLRATAILARAQEDFNLLDLLTEMLHDKLEDITPDKFPAELFGSHYWGELEEEFNQLLKIIDPHETWYLMERLDVLTRRAEVETYYAYTGRLVSRATETPELVRIKLADRLDNTLDLRINLVDPLENTDFFADIFQLLFVHNYHPRKPEFPHPEVTPLNGAARLYQLFKNAVLLSLVRKNKDLQDDPTSEKIFAALAEASLKEAQRIVFHIFLYHYEDASEQRALLMEVMRYSQEGGTSRVTLPGPTKHRLDGLFLERFDHESSAHRKQKLDTLYEDKEIMVEAAIAFMVIFMSFLNDRDYYIEGIQDDGIHAQDPQ